MKISEYSKLTHVSWEQEHQDRINKLFKGNEKDWLKKSLATVRAAAKADLLARQYSRCAYCRRLIMDEPGRCELDHVIPKSELPQFTYYRLNLVAACKRCNHRKREHNPLKRKVKNRVNYPVKEDDYVWVHPYMHRYQKHIRVDKNGFFVPVASSPKGLAVITICGLDTMQQAETVRRRAIAMSHQDFFDAVAELVNTSPHASDDTLAQDLQQRYPQAPITLLVRHVHAYRNAHFKLLGKLRNSLANSPDAKYLK